MAVESGKHQKEAVKALFAEYRTHRDPAIRDKLVVMHTDLVRFIVARFVHRGESSDDLYQVGCLGLFNAIERYDADRGTEFSTYATPTIVGEIKRYFRDRGWAMRVPRRLQELKAAVTRLVNHYVAANGRTPTVQFIAQALKVTEDDVLEAQELGNAYNLVSLDAQPEKEGARGPSLLDCLGVADAGLQNVEDQVALEKAIQSLEPREQLLIHLRFYRGMSQSDAARILEVSQMHVSRLQARALEHLRASLQED